MTKEKKKELKELHYIIKNIDKNINIFEKGIKRIASIEEKIKSLIFIIKNKGNKMQDETAINLIKEKREIFEKRIKNEALDYDCIDKIYLKMLHVSTAISNCDIFMNVLEKIVFDSACKEKYDLIREIKELYESVFGEKENIIPSAYPTYALEDYIFAQDFIVFLEKNIIKKINKEG